VDLVIALKFSPLSTAFGGNSAHLMSEARMADSGSRYRVVIVGPA
jgi:hypothetical protein